MGLASVASGVLAVTSCPTTITIEPPSGPSTSQMVATPTFSPAGGIYTSNQSVTMSDSTSGAVIYYTTDGSVPTTSSTQYTGPVTVSGNGTMEVILAIGTLSGSSDSGLAAGSYKISHIITTVAGNGTSGYSGDGNPATNAKLASPAGIAMDSSGNYYIADSMNWVVRKVTNTGTISPFAGDHVQGYVFADGAAATSVPMYYPAAVALDSATTPTTLYIVDSSANAVYRVDLGTSKIYHFAGTPGSSGSTGDGGLATSAFFNTPCGVAVDSSGNVYIADFFNYVVREVKKSDGKIYAFAGNYSAGFAGDGGPSGIAQLSGPMGVAVDSSNNVYIADTYNGRVRKVSTLGTITTVVGGPSTNSFWQDGSPATSQCDEIMTVALDSSSILYFTTYFNKMFWVLKMDGSGHLWIMAGGGDSSTSLGDSGPAVSAALSLSDYYCYPSGIAVDTAGGLYIADTFDNRIRKVQ
jgi:sugar lactone lactonase YvrE